MSTEPHPMTVLKATVNAAVAKSAHDLRELRAALRNAAATPRYTVGDRVAMLDGSAGAFLGAAGLGFGWVARDGDNAEILQRIRDLRPEGTIEADDTGRQA